MKFVKQIIVSSLICLYRWSLIAGRLPGRTDNEIKNYWNTNLSKKIMSQRPSEKNVSDEKNDKSASSNSEPHKVIKTKALRCTKVYIPPPQADMKANSADNIGGLQCIDSISSPFSLPLDLNIEELMSSFHDNNMFNLVDTNVDDCDDQGSASTCWLGEAMQEEWREGDPLDSDVFSEMKDLASLLDSKGNGHNVEPFN